MLQYVIPYTHTHFPTRWPKIKGHFQLFYKKLLHVGCKSQRPSLQSYNSHFVQHITKKGAILFMCLPHCIASHCIFPIFPNQSHESIQRPQKFTCFSHMLPHHCKCHFCLQKQPKAIDACCHVTCLLLAKLVHCLDMPPCCHHVLLMMHHVAEVCSRALARGCQAQSFDGVHCSLQRRVHLHTRGTKKIILVCTETHKTKGRP